MGAFSCLILAGVLLHLVLSDVSHTIDSNRQNVKSEQAARSNYYQPPQGYDYSGSYSTVSPENKAQYVTPASSKTSYDSYPSGQVSSDQYYKSAKQENYPQYQNDRGVLLISKELQVPFVSSKGNGNSDGCEETSNINQQIQNDETSKPAVKTSNYEIRRPGIRKEFYDIEEKVFIKPAGSAIFELQHDKPHSSAIINKHIYQQQTGSDPLQFSDYDSQYYPQRQQPFDYSHANHGYNPVIIQSPSVPSSPGYGYNPVVVQPGPQYVPYPNTYNYNPVYPSTTVTPEYIPPVTGAYLPPCEDVPNPTPQPPKPEFSDEHDDDEHDYDSDAGYISEQKANEYNKENVDVEYAPSKSNSNREREDYRISESPVYNGPGARVQNPDRVRHEYQNQRGDLAQQKSSQYPEQFHHEYVPYVNVNQNKVQIRPNADPLAKYSQERGSSQVEIENSQRLLDLYSANGDVTEIGFNGRTKSQQYQVPNKNVQARVVSVTPAPKYANYVDEQTKSRRVVLSKPLYTVQQVEVREHGHRLVEDIQSDSVEPKVSEFEKLRIIGSSSGKSSSDGQAEVNKQVEYITPVPPEYAHLRAGSPVPENLQ